MATNPYGAQFRSCQRCGAERRSLSARFCTRCGQPLLSERALNAFSNVYEVVGVLGALASLGLAVWFLRVLWVTRSGLWEFLKLTWG
jgi:hypothetical protein